MEREEDVCVSSTRPFVGFLPSDSTDASTGLTRSATFRHIRCALDAFEAVRIPFNWRNGRSGLNHPVFAGLMGSFALFPGSYVVDANAISIIHMISEHQGSHTVSACCFG